jgi:hypothetical protein
MDCDFTIPLNYLSEAPVFGEPFAFSKMTCVDASTSEYINTGNGSNFYLKKSLSYGDILIIVFLILFFVSGVFRLLWNFNFKDWNSKL